MQWQRRRWVLQPQAQGRPGHQKLRRQKGPSARAPGLSRHPDLRLPPGSWAGTSGRCLEQTSGRGHLSLPPGHHAPSVCPVH